MIGFYRGPRFRSPRVNRDNNEARPPVTPARVSPRRARTETKKRRGFPRRFGIACCRRDQRSSCSTLCCDWLASASAETAIDWRGDSAWLLAASSLESASVRADEPVCNTLIRFLLKSWRICTIDRLAPKAEACDRSVALAVLSVDRTVLVVALSRKSVPAVSDFRPRPAGPKVTPVIVEVDLPVSSNTS